MRLSASGGANLEGWGWFLPVNWIPERHIPQGYHYLDFVKIGIPLNLITWIVGVIAITVYFPF